MAFKLGPSFRETQMNAAETETNLQIAHRIIEVTPYRDIYPRLLAKIPEIMEAWDLKTDQLPWSALEATERQNNLAAVVTRVVDCAMGSESRTIRVSKLVEAALGHGKARREQNVSVESLFIDYDIVRTATWEQLKLMGGEPVMYDAIFTIDGLLSVASRLTVLGYHKDEMVAGGRWNSQLKILENLILT
jgi:hypothetical protein